MHISIGVSEPKMSTSNEGVPAISAVLQSTELCSDSIGLRDACDATLFTPHLQHIQCLFGCLHNGKRLVTHK